MQALNLVIWNKCPIPFPLGEEAGYGSDGQIFNISNDPEKVIKFSVLYENDIPLEQEWHRIDAVLSCLEQQHPSACARVFRHEYITISKRATFSGEQRYLLYYYLMEKCQKISEDEKKVFHSILSHEDNNLIKDFSLDKIKEILNGLSTGLDFDYEMVIRFMEDIKDCPINHNDLHQRNVMKNIDGFRLIDFDRGTL